MHEMAIVQSLIEQTQLEVEKAGQKGRVVGLDVVVGRLSGINCDSIRFAFEMLAPGTPLEGARMQITEPKATCNCRSCRARLEIDELVVECPQCGSRDISIEGGRDLILQSIEIED